MLNNNGVISFEAAKQEKLGNRPATSRCRPNGRPTVQPVARSTVKPAVRPTVKPADRPTVKDSDKVSTQSKPTPRVGSRGERDTQGAAQVILQGVAQIGSFCTGLIKKRWFLITATSLVSAVMIGIMVYQPAKNYYVSIRQCEELQMQYDGVLTENQNLALEVESLKTEKGIETEARKQLGWAKEGETAVEVSGMPVSNDSSEEKTSASQAHWYTSLLDFIFGIA